MSRSAQSTNVSGRIDPCTVESIARTIPHVKAMTAAIRRKDETAAIESGKAAIAEMKWASLLRSPRPSQSR
jgi:hypothetical protein